MSDPSQPLKPGAYRFVVTEEFSGLRIDQYLSEASDKFSRSRARRLIDLGGVHQAGRRTRRCSQLVASGEMIEVFVDNQPMQPMCLDEGRIIYHDQDLIVIDKPAGMPTQPTPARYQGTVFSELQNLLRQHHRKDLRPSIGMVQRLDRDTSGVMVFSIHKRAHKNLTEQFRRHDIGKIYWALIQGRPLQDQGVIKSSLAKRRSTNLMVSVAKGGKAAETRYRLLSSAGIASHVEVELVTGRSHQIRAHFSEAGHPLLGDAAYGGPTVLDDVPLSRQMLHSRQLIFKHPVTGSKLEFVAELPADFVNVLRQLDVS